MNFDKIIFKYNEYILKHLSSFVVFIILFAFDIIVLFNVKNYYNKPFINKNYVRNNGYTKDLARDGFVKINSNYYYCDQNAIIVKDKIVKCNDKEYYLAPTGILIIDKKNFKINDNFYDIDKDGVLTKVD